MPLMAKLYHPSDVVHKEETAYKDMEGQGFFVAAD